METKLIENGNTAELMLNGHLDTRTVKETEPVLKEAGEKYDTLTLNLAELSYISSAGIRALRDLYMVFYNKQGTLKMINVNDRVMKVLDMTGLTGLLNLN